MSYIFLSKGGVAYAANAVEFDGTNDELTDTSTFSATGSKKALIVFNIFRPTAWASTRNIVSLKSGASARVACTALTNGNLRARFYNSSATEIASITTSGLTFSPDTFYTVAIDLDTTTGTERIQMHMKPKGGSWSDVTNVTSVTADGIIGDVTACSVGIATFAVYLADLWATIGETLNMASGPNQAKFNASTDKGADGSTPTGTAPALFLHGPTATWHTNKGTGGGLDLTGLLTTAPSAP